MLTQLKTYIIQPTASVLLLNFSELSLCNRFYIGSHDYFENHKQLYVQEVVTRVIHCVAMYRWTNLHGHTVGMDQIWPDILNGVPALPDIALKNLH